MATNPQAFIIKRNDTLPTITVDFLDEAGDPVDLTDASNITFVMYTDSDSPTEIVNAQAFVVGDPTNGSIEYGWDTSDTATAGDYLAEFAVTLIGGAKVTLPVDGYIHVKVIPDLDDA